MVPGSPAPRPLREFTPAVLALVAVIVYGTAGYVVVEGFGWLDALFMTIITVTTVGYEEVHHLDAAGQGFTISLIIFGVAAFLYTFGVLVEQLSSGRWQEFRRYRRMDSQLRALRDHVIVCGYGRTGTQVVKDLENGGHRYVVVETNPTALEGVRRDAPESDIEGGLRDRMAQRRAAEAEGEADEGQPSPPRRPPSPRSRRPPRV